MPDREHGFALVAALVAMAIFSAVAIAMLSAERGNLAGVAAERQQARLAAAHLADRGLGSAPWRIDGRDYRDYRERLGEVSLTIRIEDERGKIRLNELSDAQARLMFEGAGAEGRRVDELTDAFLDWIDTDDDVRPNGAEAADYARLGYRPRNGAMRTVGELAMVRGMDRRLYDRLAPAVTVFFGGAGAFEPATAHPLAIAVMTETGMGSPEVIARQRELAGQRTALEPDGLPALGGRPLTVRVTAQTQAGDRMERVTIIEFPSATLDRWEIRYRE